jgi:aliphatic sulfonates family ABC transporter substrate-binding protein
MQRLITALSSLLIVALFPIGPRSVLAEDAIPINIGWQPGTYYAFYVARDAKLFEKNGLKPNFVKFTAGPPMFAAFQSNSIDVSWGGAVPAIVGSAQGVPLRVIALESVTKNALIAKIGSPIKTVADLKGKRVGTVKGSGAYFAMVKLLNTAGLDGKYDFVDMQMPSLLPAFTQGDVDAIWVWEPWASRAATEGRRIADEINIFGAYPGAPIMARSDWLVEQPEAVRRFLAALHMAQQSYHKNPSHAVAAMASELGIPETMAQDIFKEDPKPTFERQTTAGDAYAIVGGAEAPQIKNFQAVGDFFSTAGLINSRPDMASVFAIKPLEAYMKAPAR